MSPNKAQSSHSSNDAVVQDVSARNVVADRVSTNPVDGMATQADLNHLRGSNVPPPVDKNPRRGLGNAFTSESISVLSSPSVQAYFGTRVNIPEMVAAASRYAVYDNIRTRLENSANLAAQIGAPDGMLVETELGKLMRTWSDFEAALPKEALALESFREEWSSAHPGRKAVKKTNGKSTTEVAPPETNSAPNVAPAIVKPQV